jgi:hypothetical protein
MNNLPKIDFSKLLNDLIIPIISVTITLILYFIFIGPYLTLNSTFKKDKIDFEAMITGMEAKKKILSDTRSNLETLKKYESRLTSLVPTGANASDLVGVLDTLSRVNNFSVVEENKNVVSPENAKKKISEVRFNGKTAGMLSAVNFISEVTYFPTKVFNITKLEITNNYDDKFTRVSFNAISNYNPDKAIINIEASVTDYLNNKSFVDEMEALISKN